MNDSKMLFEMCKMSCKLQAPERSLCVTITRCTPTQPNTVRLRANSFAHAKLTHFVAD